MMCGAWSVVLSVLLVPCWAVAGGRSYHVTPENHLSMGFRVELRVDRKDSAIEVSFPAQAKRKGGKVGRLADSSLRVAQPLLEVGVVLQDQAGEPPRKGLKLRLADELLRTAVLKLHFVYGEPGDEDEYFVDMRSFAAQGATEQLPNPHR